MAAPKKDPDELHDNPLYTRLQHDDYAFLVAEANRQGIPKNVLARSWLREVIKKLRKERLDSFKNTG